MRSIQTKITRTYILLAIAVIAAAGVISSYALESYFKSRMVDELDRQADLVLESFKQDSSVTFAQLDRRLKVLGQSGKIRITFISADGRVVDDSDVPADKLSTVDNHLQRPEIQEALRDGIGIDTRHSNTVKKDLLYVAKVIVPSANVNFLNEVQFVRLSMPLEEVQAIMTGIRLNILLAGLIVLILVFIVSRLISRRISRHIVEISKRVEEIRAGNYDTRIDIATDDEICLVAQAVNELVDKLKADIVQLKKLERVRSEFLGNVSHELRTPIFSLQGFLETLLDGAVDDPGVNRLFLEKAYRNATQLNALLMDLIDISQMEAGELKLSFRYFSVPDFLRDIVSEIQPLAEHKQIALSVQDTPLPFEAYGDRDRLKNVLMNLLSNAIKYTESGGHIWVSYEAGAKSVKISVRDSGVGIAPEDQERIFERFYRVDKQRSREAGGTGLGLAIVKHIVEAHGSKVEVSSEPGKGSTFSFSLKAG